jgi:type II secretory pathway component PulJ
MPIVSDTTAWYVGFALGFVVVVVAVIIVAIILALASRIADQAEQARRGVDAVRAQTEELSGIGQINDSGVRILHAARALRKVAVGR